MLAVRFSLLISSSFSSALFADCVPWSPDSPVPSSLFIGKVQIENNDVFDTCDESENTRLHRTANVLFYRDDNLFGGGLDTRVNGYPVLLDFRKRVVYFSYTFDRLGIISRYFDNADTDINFMPEKTSAFDKAFALIDTANSQDPNQVSAEGKEWPKELLYSNRMSDMLWRYAPGADDAMKLAIRSQHIQRWKSPRNAYPMDRIGYLKWRKDLYKIQGNAVAELIEQAGYGADVIERIKTAVAKKNIKGNPDTQLLEDVADLVFLEYYLLEFVGKHPEYSEEKWIDIIQKTWHKMSELAREFSLSGQLDLPESLVPLIKKAVSNASSGSG